MSSPTPPAIMPEALLSLDDPASEAAFELAQARLHELLAQRTVLEIAQLFKRHPLIERVGFEFERSGELDQVSEAVSLSNRSSRYHQLMASARLKKKVLPQPCDAIFPSESDEAAEKELSAILKRIIHRAQEQFDRKTLFRPQTEPLIPGLMRQALSPDQFAAWERSHLASAGSEPAERARPRSL